MSDPTVRKLLEQLSDEWCNALQSDLEHGVSSQNEKAACEFHQKYKAISEFGKMLNDLYLNTCDD
jgi:hypothetical protein